jgi:RNA polymerase sigma factor (sigma-70 family)
MYNDNHTLQRLRKRENAAYNLLYNFYYPYIEKFVLRNSGSAADAQDVFQETIIVLLDKVPKEDFTLTSSMKTYMMAVASNIWLKRLRDARRVLHSNESEADNSLQNWELMEYRSTAEDSNLNLLQRIFQRMTRHCVIFLTKTFLNGLTRDKLMEEMGYRNTHTFDNQKYKCLEQARKNNSPNG